MRRFGVALGVTLLAAGCARPGTASPGAIQARDGGVPAAVPCSRLDVAAQLEDLLRQKRTMRSTGPGGVKLSNAGGWAYMSEPVDVTTSAVHTFTFGPLDSDFNYPESPEGFGFTAPADFAGTVRPAAAQPHIVQDGDTRYFDFSAAVETSVPCDGLVLFIS